jgi:hypothetical protein
MYYAWKLHNISPLVYKSYGYGEKKIISVFLDKELEEINKNQESI